MSNAIRFNLNDPDLNLAGVLSRFPPSFKTQFAAGIKVLSTLTDELIERLLNLLKDSIASAASVDEKEIASELAISPEGVSSVLLAANILMVTLASADSSDEMVRQLREAHLIEEHETGPIQFLRSVVSNKSSVTEALRRSTLTSESLPVMTELEATVDIRPAFDKETSRINFAVPVLIMHIDTDKYGAEIWFQLSKRQVEKMIDGLKTALQQMTEAERWSTSQSEPQQK